MGLALGDHGSDGRWRCGLAGGWIGDEFDGPEHAEPADFADARVALGDVTQRRSDDVVAEMAGVCEDALLLEDANARNGRRTRERVARVGESTGEHLGVEVVGDRAGDHHAAEWDVAGVDALREHDEVGLCVPVLPREPLPGATESGHHLIGDPHDAELVTDRP